MKKIAVITPTYNRAHFIKDCIDSVSESITYNLFTIEHIIVDDGSTDDTRKLLEKIDNIKTFYLGHNKGQSYARNYAVQKTDADYIFALDSDDIIFQNSLRYLFTFLEELKQEWVCTDILRCNEKMEYIIGRDFWGWKFDNILQALESIFTGRHLLQQNMFYSRRLF